jgi:hypothetical protein
MNSFSLPYFHSSIFLKQRSANSTCTKTFRAILVLFLIEAAAKTSRCCLTLLLNIDEKCLKIFPGPMCNRAYLIGF